MPLDGRITRDFGNGIHPITGENKFHNGIDIGAPSGSKIISPGSGIVESIYTHASGGKSLIIRHDNGYITGFAHLSNWLVKQGDKVKRGQPIAQVGSTGQSTGPHLHLTLKDSKGNSLNPMEHLI